MITTVFVCIIGARANKPTALHAFGLETAFVHCVIRIASCIGETCSSRARTTQTAAGDCQAEVQKSVKGIILISARANYAQSHSQCSLGSSLFFLIPKVDSLFSPHVCPWPTLITNASFGLRTIPQHLFFFFVVIR